MILKGLIFIAVLAAALFIAYFFSRRRLRARLASQSQVVQTALGPVEYIDVGKGPVVIHTSAITKPMTSRSYTFAIPEKGTARKVITC